MEQVPEGLPLSQYITSYPSLDLRMIPFGTKIHLRCGRVWEKIRGVDYPWYRIIEKHGTKDYEGRVCTCCDDLGKGDVRWIPSMPLWEVEQFEGPLNWKQWADTHWQDAPAVLDLYSVDRWLSLSREDLVVTTGRDIRWMVMNHLVEQAVYVESGSIVSGSFKWTKTPHIV